LQLVFLSHDVDWNFNGPPKDHILKIKNRFDEKLFQTTPINKLYRNFSDYMEIEEKYNTKSTFFFRTQYENGDYRDYHDDIKKLKKEGWEIGLHTDPSSVDNIFKIQTEKDNLEKILGSKIYGNRVHYLSNDEKLLKKLSELDFMYDSSFRKTKDTVTLEDMGYRQINKITEFPVTLMDAYIFTYMKIKEEKIIELVANTLDSCRKLNLEFNVMTILWHDNVLKMKGGRMYSKILEFLSSQDDVKLFTGIDLATFLKRKNLL